MKILAVNVMNLQNKNLKSNNVAPYSNSRQTNQNNRDTFCSNVSFGMTPAEKAHFAIVYPEQIVPIIDAATAKLEILLKEVEEYMKRLDFKFVPHLEEKGSNYLSYEFFDKKNISAYRLWDKSSNLLEDWCFDWGNKASVGIEHTPVKSTSVVWDKAGNVKRVKIFEPESSLGFSYGIKNGEIVDSKPFIDKDELFYD